MADKHGMTFDPTFGNHDKSLIDSFYSTRVVVNKQMKGVENVDVNKFILPPWEDVVLEEGEMIVTANWWHQAFNTVEGFSVSGSTVNLANIQRVLLDMLHGGPKRQTSDLHDLNACRLLRNGAMMYGSEWRDNLLLQLDGIAQQREGGGRWLQHKIQTIRDNCGQAPVRETANKIVEELGDLDGPYRKWIGWGKWNSNLLFIGNHENI